MTTSGDFVKVFDVLDSGFKDWSFSAFGLIFVIAGIFLFVSPRLIKSKGIPSLQFQSQWKKSFRYFFLGFAVLWSTTSFYLTYSRYLRHQNLVRSGSCPIVEGQEVRFSSGFPFIMVLFLWTAYQVFNIAMPSSPNGVGSGQLVGIAAVMFVVVGFINLKILKSRMEKLIQDAVAELKTNNIS